MRMDVAVNCNTNSDDSIRSRQRQSNSFNTDAFQTMLPFRCSAESDVILSMHESAEGRNHQIQSFGKSVRNSDGCVYTL